MTDERTGVPDPIGDDTSQVAVKRGALRFYSERTGGKPYNNCLINAAMTGLRWMGYDVPDSYDDVIRQAAGVPDPQGTTLAEVYTGISKLLMPAPTLEQLTLDDFMAALKPVDGRGRRKSVFAVIVNTAKLPVHYQRLVGQGYDGLHGLAIVAKTDVPVPSVLQFDPMGKAAPGKNDDPQTFTPYRGELMALTDLLPAIAKNDAGLIKTLRFPKNGARVTL